MPCTYPDGSDIEYDFKTLKKTYQLAKLPSQKSMLLLHVASKLLKKKNRLNHDYSKIRYTVDWMILIFFHS